jgi:hypothetical protein
MSRTSGAPVRGPRAFSDDVVLAKTGKRSAGWYRILDRWGADQKGHTATARYLREQHGVSPWWAQAVTNR